MTAGHVAQFLTSAAIKMDAASAAALREFGYSADHAFHFVVSAVEELCGYEGLPGLDCTVAIADVLLGDFWRQWNKDHAPANPEKRLVKAMRFGPLNTLWIDGAINGSEAIMVMDFGTRRLVLRSNAHKILPTG